MFTDQQHYWNNLHKQGNLDHYIAQPTPFAEEVNALIPSNSVVLELGCGVGNDTAFFAQSGHTIYATDFSDVAIEKNKNYYVDFPAITFQVMDMKDRFEFENEICDVVYARLSLHYFTDKVTKSIFKEIHRVLKPSGYLCFMCKSRQDPQYGNGLQIEKDMFEYKGHIRHFFSEEYVKDCLANLFTPLNLESGKDIFYGKESGYVKVIARKI